MSNKHSSVLRSYIEGGNVVLTEKLLEVLELFLQEIAAMMWEERINAEEIVFLED